MGDSNKYLKETEVLLEHKQYHIIPGILLCFMLAVPSWLLGKTFPIIGGPVFAIIIGILISVVCDFFRCCRRIEHICRDSRAGIVCADGNRQVCDYYGDGRDRT